MLYHSLYMVPRRTQIYLSVEQRRRLDVLAARDGTSLAQLIREAVDKFLEASSPNPEHALAATFGRCPDLVAPPRDDWTRGTPAD